MLDDAWTTGALIDIAAEALAIGVRTDIEIGALADVLTNVFASELVDVGIDRPVGVFAVVASAVIALEFVVSTEVSTSCAIDVLVDASSGKIVAHLTLVLTCWMMWMELCWLIWG